MLEETYRSRRVLVTGHTGFKGSWLSEWLLSLGAQVSGVALAPEPDARLFGSLGLAGRLDHHEGDIRDRAFLGRVVQELQPDFVFHLAAQPLVRLSYRQPFETFEVNTIGTACVLEAVRSAGCRCSVVAVTTDKCYENREWLHSYREEDPLGGHDPYSASKGAAEIVIASYRRSFFSSPDSRVRLASARAGNVLGGGDWAADRIVPDCMRSLRAARPVQVRSPRATRPWQHVLEPLSGYLWLGACLDDTRRAGTGVSRFDEAYNFGPGLAANRSVGDLVTEILRHWPGERSDSPDPGAPHEASLLNLSIDKAWHRLGWRPVWPFETCVERTVSWYREAHADESRAAELTRSQIRQYCSDARAAGLKWSL